VCFQGKRSLGNEKNPPEGVGKLVAIVGFTFENEQQKRHILGGGFKHFSFLHRKTWGNDSILASTFFSNGLQLVCLCMFWIWIS